MFRPLGRLSFLLALWMQILAPMAAVQAVLAADDPLAGLTICGDSLDGAAGADDEHRGMPAPLCGLCCAAVAVLGPTPPTADAIAFTWRALAFTAQIDAWPASIRPYSTRVRAPPALG